MHLTQRLAALVLAGAVSLSVSTAFAQQAQAPGQGQGRGQRQGRRGGTIPDAWLTRLKLSADQSTKVKAATEAYRGDLEKARALNMEDRRAASQAARTSYQTAVKAALTPDQQKQLQAMMDEAQAFGMGPIGMQLAGLGLTTEQKAKVKEIAAKHQPKLDELRASQRTASDRQAVRTEMRAEQQKMLDEIKTVLTPEQQKQLLPLGQGRRRNAGNA
jgi:Spy/CpxP family protein refolding chaperone